MADSAQDIATAHQWSISQIARAFGMDRRTVTKRLEDGGVKPASSRGGFPVYELKAVGPALFGQVMVGGTDPNNMPPNERRAWYQSENERLKFEREMSQLVPMHDVRREMSSMAKGMANTLDSLPDILERDCGLSAEALDRVQEVVDTQREQMYLRIIEDGE